ncbi:ATP synthase F0F1 [Burkholderia sp. MSMB1078WGS]|uniref:DUF3472 domain-containing protein n=1 Tax=Burkholderia sp. MSMB1078WGS TaxID=1637900 RepID=UPI0007565834|nr:ATP synthase F0F1 [Burkholderia sp. MSMB1078WGS]KVT09772.1 ATP synthase F0F1 [Burkholderia sp. MSMB1078WGS]
MRVPTRLITSATFAISASLTAHADPNISAAARSTPAGGYDRMTWDITPIVVPTTVNRSYYWANQLTSERGGHAIYTGIQPRTEGSNLVIFSAFGTGTTPLASNCRGGADGGSGTSCSLAYAWKPGRRYQLEIAYSVPAVNGGNATIEGFITDMAAGTRMSTGKISVPSSWGGLSRFAYLFDEYFPFNGGPKDPAQRACVPYVRYTTSLPSFYLKGVEYSTTEQSVRLGGGKDKCAVAVGTPNARSTLVNTATYLIENGFLPGSPGAPK